MNIHAPLNRNKTLEEWDQDWEMLPGGLMRRHRDLKRQVGLYRLSLQGCDMFIGTGLELTGGLDKRLYDFVRLSDSGRDYAAGRKIYEARHELELQVLTTGFNQHAQMVGRQLGTLMIERHKPEWNVAEG